MKTDNFIYLFDLDGTLGTFPINYTLLYQILEIIYNKKKFRPLLDKIREYSKNELEAQKSLLIVDLFEVQAVKESLENKQITSLYRKLVKNNKVMILTRNGLPMVEATLKKFNLPRPLEILSREKFKHVKPDRECIDYLLKKYKVEPNQILLFGDGFSDIELADRTGICFVHKDIYTK